MLMVLTFLLAPENPWSNEGVERRKHSTEDQSNTHKYPEPDKTLNPQPDEDKTSQARPSDSHAQKA